VVKSAVQRREQIVRILQLIAESGALSLSQVSLDDPGGVVHIQVSDEDSEFSTVFPMRLAESNIRIQNLFRLLKEYSAPTVTGQREGGTHAQS
jgi:hypothetical protein